MAKETLLEIVQDILSDADGDEVNSISDTIESDQCARVVRTVFNNIVDGSDFEHHDTIIRLNATSASTPNVMTRPEGLYDIQWIKYNSFETAGDDQEYETITYMRPVDFFDLTSRRTASDSDVSEIALDSGHSMLVKTAQAPKYWTMMEDYDDVIFDAYDSDLETNLQNSKSLAFGTLKPTLALTDAATADLPKNLFNRLKNEARALYFDLYKDGVTPEIDRLRRRTEVRSQRHRHVADRVNPRTGLDATGKKWNIYTERGRHLFFARPEPDRADAVIPKDLAGRWTKRMLLDSAIKLHVRRSWDHADEVRIKNERKAQAAKEAQANARKETKESKNSKDVAAKA
jgi:hypothetical protein